MGRPQRLPEVRHPSTHDVNLPDPAPPAADHVRHYAGRQPNRSGPKPHRPVERASAGVDAQHEPPHRLPHRVTASDRATPRRAEASMPYQTTSAAALPTANAAPARHPGTTGTRPGLPRPRTRPAAVSPRARSRRPACATRPGGPWPGRPRPPSSPRRTRRTRRSTQRVASPAAAQRPGGQVSRGEPGDCREGAAHLGQPEPGQPRLPQLLSAPQVQYCALNGRRWRRAG